MALPKLYSVANVTGLYRTTTRHTPTSIYYARVQLVVDPDAPDPKDRKASFSRKLGVFASAESASDMLRIFRNEVRGKAGKTAPPEQKTVRTLVEAQKAQLVEKSITIKPSTLKTYERENRNAQRFFGRKTTVLRVDPDTESEYEEEIRDCLLSELTRARIQEWIRFRLDACAAATMNRDLARLRGVMRWAEREGWLPGGNPINQVPQLRELEGAIRYLGDEEEKRLKEHSPDWLWRMIEFAFWTGLRREEQLSLRWDQIKLRLIEVVARSTKSSRPRWIPITETVQHILDEQRGANPIYVFPNRTGKNRWNPYNFFRNWDKVREAAGMGDYRWHDHRHTFCSRLVQEGVELTKIQALAGHRDFKTTLRYAHLAPTHLRAPMDALEARRRRQLLQIAGLQPEALEEQPTGATQQERTA